MKNPFNFLKTKSASSGDIYSFLKSNDLTSVSTSISPLEALNTNKTSLYINKGFSKRAEKVGEIKFELKDKKGDIVEDNEILDLLDNPNPDMTGATFWNLATNYRDVTGMAVMVKVTNGEVFSEDKKVEKLELLNSAYVEVVENTDKGGIKSFRYTNPTTKVVREIPYEQCIYWHIPDPTNPIQPLPLLLAGMLSIQSNQEMDKQYNATLKNGGTIDGLFRFKEGLTQDQVTNLKKDYAKLLRDNKEGNVPLILGGDASFERVALSPQELQTLEAKKQLIEDMLVVTGVPKSILGIATGDSYANAETAYRIFLRETIKPIMTDLISVLNWKLVSEDYDLDFIDPTPENVEENLKKLEIGDRVGVYTLNEKREILGLEPVKDGDEIQPKETITPPADSEKKNLNFNHPLKSEKFRDTYYTDFVKSIKTNKVKFKKELDTYFAGQKQRILKEISSMKSFDSVKKQDLAFELLNEPLEIAYMTPLLRTMEQITKEEGEKTAELFKQDFYYNSSVDEVVNARFLLMARSINKTTSKILNKEFEEWFNNNESVADLSNRVSDVYDFNKSEKWRSDMIVNTEVSTITNLAKGEAYGQMNISTKIWVHRAGIKGGVRDEHASMDGEEVKFNEYFSNGMKHPHDPMASGSENINCMCTW